MKRTVIIVVGQAGAALAAKLRKLGHEGQQNLVCSDSRCIISRPAVSKKILMQEMSV